MAFQLKHLAMATLALTGATAAQADLAGATISEEYFFPNESTPYSDASYAPATFAVAAGVDSTVDIEGVTFIAVDFAADSLDLLFNTRLGSPTWTSAPFNGLVFTGPALSTITGFTIDPASTFAGFDASRVTFSGNELRLNWNGLSYTDGVTLGLDFTFGAVPEPASWALMIAGFGLVGTALRRRPALA